MGWRAHDMAITSVYDKAAGALLAKLPERAQEVIARRYGLLGEDSETLEEIGEGFGVTRERVRQIEANALAELRLKHEQLASPIFRDLEKYLRDRGMLRAEHHMHDDFSPRMAPATLQFFLDLGPSFTRYRETAHRHPVWSLDAERLREAEAFERSVAEKLAEVGKELEKAEFWKLVEQEARRNRLVLAERARQSWIGISRNIARGPSETWGLVSWPEINPHNVGDWAFIVLRSAKAPMHFSEIVRGMNTLEGRKGRRAHVQTVHNELIKDPRFVLVGRGLYALYEWGYEPGTIRDVITRILKEAKNPLTKDAIIAKVASVRKVQDNTIVLNLQNKAVFAKTADGKYTLRASSGPIVKRA